MYKSYKLLMMLLFIFCLGLTTMGETTEVEFQIDMSIIWEGDLPEEVNLFLVDNSWRSNENIKDENGNPITQGFSKNNLDNGKLYQNTNNALKLKDGDTLKDGVYTGSIFYDGSIGEMYYILYVEKKEKTGLKTYYYETGIGDNTDNPIMGKYYDGQNFIKGAKRKINLYKNNREKLIIRDAWESKTVSNYKLNDGNLNLEIIEGMYTRLNVVSSYNNAASELKRDISEYVGIRLVNSADEKYIDIKGGIIKAKNLEDNEEFRIINLEMFRSDVGSKNEDEIKKEFKVVIKKFKVSTSGQTIAIRKSNDNFNVNTEFELQGFGDKIKVGASEGKSLNKNTYITTEVNLTKNDVGNYQMISNDINTLRITRDEITEKGIFKYNEKEYELLFNKKAKSIKTNTKPIGIDFFIDGMDLISNEFDGNYVVFRFSMINDVNNYGLDSDKGLHLENKNFEELFSEGKGYVDVVFDLSNLAIQTNLGISFDFNLSSKKLTLMGFIPYNQYRLQAYTYRSKNLLVENQKTPNFQFAVSTFEAEVAFAGNEDINDNNIGADSDFYFVENTNPEDFTTITVDVTTRTNPTYTLTSGGIYYENISTSGTEIKKGLSEELFENDTRKSTAEGSDLNVEELELGNLRFPVDVIFVLDHIMDTNDKQNKMSDKIKEIAGKLEGYNKSLDIKYNLFASGFSYETSQRDKRITTGDWTSYKEFENFLPTARWKFDNIDYSNNNANNYQVMDVACKYFKDNGRVLGGLPSTKFLVFITDSYQTQEDEGAKFVDRLASTIREQNINVTGIAPVGFKQRFTVDDGGYDIAENNKPIADDDNGYENYYHLRFILGDLCSLFDINNSDDYVKNIITGFEKLKVFKKWRISYTTPNQNYDATKRFAMFKINRNTENWNDGEEIEEYQSIESFGVGKNLDSRKYYAPGGGVELNNPNAEIAPHINQDVKFDIEGENIKLEGMIQLYFMTDDNKELYKEIQKVELKIIPHKLSPDDSESITVTINEVGISLISSNPTDKEGDWYKFEDSSLSVESLKSLKAEADLFDIEVTGYTNTNKKIKGMFLNIKLEEKKAIIIKGIEFENTSLKVLWSGMTNQGEKIFDIEEVEKFSKFRYEYNPPKDEFEFPKDPIDLKITSNNNLFIKSKINTEEYFEGYYMKNGDNFNLTVYLDLKAPGTISETETIKYYTDLYDLKIEEKNFVTSSDSNELFTLRLKTDSDPKLADEYNIVAELKNVTCDSTQNTTSNEPGNIKLSLTKNAELKNMLSHLNTIDIAIIDNEAPNVFNEEDESSMIYNYNDTEKMQLENFYKGNYYTNTDYKIDLSITNERSIDKTPSTEDLNGDIYFGIRAFEGKYSFDETMSDFEITNDGKTPIEGYRNKDINLEGDIENIFYGIAYMNSINDVSTTSGGITRKIATSDIVETKTLKRNHDDGLYTNMKFSMYDRAGNVNEYKDFSETDNFLYVDTIAPRALNDYKEYPSSEFMGDNGVLVKKNDAFEPGQVFETLGFEPVSEKLNDYIKYGDIVSIVTGMQDFNFVDAEESLTEFNVELKKDGENPIIDFNILGTTPLSGEIKSKNDNNMNAVFISSERQVQLMNTSTVNYDGEYRYVINVKDLAGNPGKTEVKFKLDNTPPKKITAKLKVRELIKGTFIDYNKEDESEGSIMYRISELKENAIDVFQYTRADDENDSGSEFYIKLTNTNTDSDNSSFETDGILLDLKFKDDIIRVEMPIFPDDYTISCSAIGIRGLETYKDENNNIRYYGLDGKYTLSNVISIDRAGWPSGDLKIIGGTVNFNITYSEDTSIIKDTEITGNLENKESDTAILDSENYTFNFNFEDILDMSGVWKISLKEISANGIKINSFANYSIISKTTPSDTVPLLSPVAQMKFTIAKNILKDLEGSRAIVTFDVTDNIGNTEERSIPYLIPKPKINLISEYTSDDVNIAELVGVGVVGEKVFDVLGKKTGGKHTIKSEIDEAAKKQKKK